MKKHAKQTLQPGLKEGSRLEVRPLAMDTPPGSLWGRGGLEPVLVLRLLRWHTQKARLVVKMKNGRM